MSEQLRGYIYSITNEINGKSYIGKTNNLVRRWREHCYGQGGTTKLDRAFKKYGLDSFVFEIVAQIPFDSAEELNEILNQLEVYYITLYDSFRNGYNATAGGEGTSYYHHTEETKKKISLSNRKYTEPQLSPYQRLSEEEKKLKKEEHYSKIAKSLSGRKRDQEMIMRGAAKRRKPILQYDLEGNFIQEFEGASVVQELFNFSKKNISACCRGKIHSAYGYIWRFKTLDSFLLKIDVAKVKNSYKRNILQYDKDGSFIKEYNSIREASVLANIGKSNIDKCLRGQRKTAGGYIWKYKKERR